MIMTSVPGAPRSVSVFLRSYSPDTFEWENSDYDPRASFVWSKPSVPFPSVRLSVRSTCQDVAALCDGRSSPGSESLSDMSISLSDAGSGLSFSILPPMIRTRATSISSRPLVLNSGSSSLSDMSISPAPSITSQSPEEFEHFVGNMPIQSSWDHSVNTAFPEERSRLLAPGPKACRAYGSIDGDMDSEAIIKMLEWTTSLFTSVASSALEYTICPDVSNGHPELIYPDTLLSENDERSFSPRSKESVLDHRLLSSKVDVKINSTRPKGAPKSIQANPDSILMPGAVDYEARNPEQPTTAKPVCMWGRRLERIPKVRIAGQDEAVYCFDSRKQRQKQKGSGVSVAPPSRQVMSNFTCKEQQKPTQIFYRARPLGAPLIRRDLPATPVDAVKITQGQVLLQNTGPVRFNATLPLCDSVKESCRRPPFTSRSNWVNNGHRVEDAPPPSLLFRKISGRGFL